MDLKENVEYQIGKYRITAMKYLNGRVAFYQVREKCLCFWILHKYQFFRSVEQAEDYIRKLKI